MRVEIELLRREERRGPGAPHREDRRELEDHRRGDDARPEEPGGLAAKLGDLGVDVELGEAGEIIHAGEEGHHREADEIVHPAHGRDNARGAASIVQRLDPERDPALPYAMARLRAAGTAQREGPGRWSRSVLEGRRLGFELR